MKHMLDRDDWIDLFEVVVTNCQKPSFYQQKYRSDYILLIVGRIICNVFSVYFRCLNFQSYFSLTVLYDTKKQNKTECAIKIIPNNSLTKRSMTLRLNSIRSWGSYAKFTSPPTIWWHWVGWLSMYLLCVKFWKWI